MENKGVEDMQKAIEKIKSGSPETAINFIKRYINGHSCEIYHQEKMQDVLDSGEKEIEKSCYTCKHSKSIVWDEPCYNCEMYSEWKNIK